MTRFRMSTFKTRISTERTMDRRYKWIGVIGNAKRFYYKMNYKRSKLYTPMCRMDFTSTWNKGW